MYEAYKAKKLSYFFVIASQTILGEFSEFVECTAFKTK